MVDTFQSVTVASVPDINLYRSNSRRHYH